MLTVRMSRLVCYDDQRRGDLSLRRMPGACATSAACVKGGLARRRRVRRLAAQPRAHRAGVAPSGGRHGATNSGSGDFAPTLPELLATTGLP